LSYHVIDMHFVCFFVFLTLSFKEAF
jgi:hypothetical protein